MKQYHDLTAEEFNILEATGLLYVIYPEENEIPHTIVVERPKPLENIDIKPLIEFTEGIIDTIIDGSYHEDNDNDHYAYEELFKAIYGDDYFDKFFNLKIL